MRLKDVWRIVERLPEGATLDDLEAELRRRRPEPAAAVLYGLRRALSPVLDRGSAGFVPVYLEPNYPEGQTLFFNTRYFSFYIHEAAAFAFTGFASTLPNFQLGYIGALVAVLEAICVKPSTITQTTGYTGAVQV